VKDNNPDASQFTAMEDLLRLDIGMIGNPGSDAVSYFVNELTLMPDMGLFGPWLDVASAELAMVGRTILNSMERLLKLKKVVS
jgi:hypothetical protein